MPPKLDTREQVVEQSELRRVLIVGRADRKEDAVGDEVHAVRDGRIFGKCLRAQPRASGPRKRDRVGRYLDRIDEASASTSDTAAFTH